MQTVETNYIRDIARELYTGRDYEKAFNCGIFTTKSYVKRVSQRLTEKLGEVNTDRIYTGKGLNKGLNTKLKLVLSNKSQVDNIDVEYIIKSNKRRRNDPIIDYDSDVSSNGDTMDQSALDTSLLDSMNDSQVSTRSTSCRMEMLEAKIDALETKNKALEVRAKAAEDQCRLWQEKSRDLFKVRYRATRANGSGKCEGFDTRLDAIVLDAENRGVAAKHVHDVCQSFVDVLGWFTEDDPEYRIVFINFYRAFMRGRQPSPNSWPDILSGFYTRETT